METNVSVPRRVSSTCDGSVSCAVMLTNDDTLYTLIRALILSHLDCCNSLFACSSHSLYYTVFSVYKTLLLDFCVVHVPGRIHHPF